MRPSVEFVLYFTLLSPMPHSHVVHEAQGLLEAGCICNRNLFPPTLTLAKRRLPRIPGKAFPCSLLLGGRLSISSGTFRRRHPASTPAHGRSGEASPRHSYGTGSRKLFPMCWLQLPMRALLLSLWWEASHQLWHFWQEASCQHAHTRSVRGGFS